MMMNFTGMKIFSATMMRDREQLGERVSQWLSDNPNVEVVDKVVTQSSDDAFHCVSVSLFYREKN